METVVLTYPFTAGALIRGALKREVQAACWAKGWDVEIKEAKGWFESEIVFRIHVPVNEAAAVKQGLDNWAREIGT
jgi:hypothetical protein